ncbi:hypothetical protein Skr01_58810 [Sphaerisporangium krabiense]|nr:hypothetical protein Skr01_58810 [Sphaerisporangium krabiense]
MVTEILVVKRDRRTTRLTVADHQPLWDDIPPSERVWTAPRGLDKFALYCGHVAGPLPDAPHPWNPDHRRRRDPGLSRRPSVTGRDAPPHAACA